jgi:thiamine-phosphate pyrophosphorylase
MQPDTSERRNSPLKLPDRGLYGITDDALLPHSEIVARVTTALDNGLALLQYRSKQALSSQALAQLKVLVVLCQSYDVPLLINDNASLCAQVGAHGVHLGQRDGSVSDARRLLGQDAIIGVTCHGSIDAALAAQQDTANYVAFGRFFPSQTKPDAAPADLNVLAQARDSLAIPIVAIGGINAENGGQLLAAGASFLAVIHSLFGSGDIQANTKKLVALFNS